MFEVWLQMSDTNIDRENPSDLPALLFMHSHKAESTIYLLYRSLPVSGVNGKPVYRVSFR